MKFNLIIFFLFSLFSLSISYKINYIRPLNIPISFSKEKDDHSAILNVTLLQNEIDSHFMLFISDYDLKYDNELLEDTMKYCQHEDVVTTDLRTLDKRMYSCCKRIQQHEKTYNYSCPIPSFPDRDILFDLISSNKFPIYIKQFWLNNSVSNNWEYSGYDMNYLQEEKIYMFFHHFILWSVFIWMICCISYTIMTYINKWSNQHEKIFTIIHILSTFLIIYVEVKVYQNSEKSFSKDIFLFSLINTFYSIFLIYIPHHKNPEDPHSVEQRVPVEDIVFQFSLKIFKHPLTKQVCSIFYISSFIMEVVSIYFFTDFLRSEYDLELEMLLFVSIFKFIFKLTFLISFLTAIYEIHVPVRINDETGQLLQILPDSHYDRVISSFINNKKVIPKKSQDDMLLGMYDSDSKQTIPFFNNFKEGEIIGYQNVNSKYKGILWQIGKIKKNKIELYNSNQKRKIYFLNIGYGHVFLPKEVDSNKNIIVYQYINKRLIRIGRIKNKYFFHDHHLLISVITTILNIIPDYVQDDYDVNVVEILRHTFHQFTNGIGEIYGYIYWTIFVCSLSICYIYSLYQNYYSVFFQIFQMIILNVLTVFNISSSLYIKHDHQENIETKNNNISEIHRGEKTQQYYFDQSLKWPNLLNTEYTKSVNYFQNNFPELKIEYIPDNVEYLNDFDNNRVMIFYDVETNLITKVPVIG